jgi:plastocyanin
MRRMIVPAFVLFVFLVAGACGGTAASAPPGSQPAASPGASTVAPTICRQAPDPVTNPVSVTISGNTYTPNPVQAKVGEPIQWGNEDGVPHTATLDDVDCDTGLISRGQTRTLVIAAAGTYPYHCEVHSTIHGTITIVQ